MSDQLPLLESLSSKELGELAKKAEKMIQDRKDSNLKVIFDQISEIAKKNDLSIDDIINLIEKNKNKRAVRKKVEIKYRNPSNNLETWTGRGKKPKWLSSALSNGADISDFLVK